MLQSIFRFTQGNLQDYADCPRRFQLKYVLEQPWPAAEASPITEYEEFLARGRRFHRLAQRHQLGLPPEALTESIADDELLMRWWRNYLESPPPNLPDGERRPEWMLSVDLAGHQLAARFDLVAMDTERAVIVDWKTTRRPQSLVWLAGRMQTRVYPFVLTEALGLEPGRIEMVYWFAEDPGAIRRFDYDSGQHEANRRELSALISEIAGRDDEVWPMADDVRVCRYCVYRSLCGRGVEAGPMAEWDAEEPDDLLAALEDVEEIAF